jgi:hypothetical protein
MTTFISYSRVNSDFAVRLAKDLKKAGLDIWFDQLDIPTGARWDDEIEKALDKSETFLIILSSESIQSQNVKDEIGYAVDAGKHILPVVLENCNVPFRLRRFQYVDFTNRPYENSLAEIKHLIPHELSQTPIVEKKPEKHKPRLTLGSIASLGIIMVCIVLVAIASYLFALKKSAPTSNLNNTMVGAKTTQPSNKPSQEVPTPIITSTVFNCPKAPNIQVKVGDKAIVMRATTRLRSKPQVSDDNIIFLLAEGDELEIIDGPICSPRPDRKDYYVFWKVTVPSRSLEGWVAEGDSDNYYVKPYQ